MSEGQAEETGGEACARSGGEVAEIRRPNATLARVANMGFRILVDHLGKEVFHHFSARGVRTRRAAQMQGAERRTGAGAGPSGKALRSHDGNLAATEEKREQVSARSAAVAWAARARSM